MTGGWSNVIFKLNTQYLKTLSILAVKRSGQTVNKVKSNGRKQLLMIAVIFNSILMFHDIYHVVKPTGEKGVDITMEFLEDVGIIDTEYNKTEADRHQEMLYAFLRQIALGPSASTNSDEPVKQRFILQIPGKVLNPSDYNIPTNDSTTQLFSSFIPPQIHENMFRLADAVAAVNPVKGGETGESFSELYEKALQVMDIRSFDKMSGEELERYDKSIAYLAETIQDPQNDTNSVTRLSLYTRLRKKYDYLHQQMEEKVKEAEDSMALDPVEYQRWLQIHFPALQADLEDAYTEWLVYGKKDIVELYKTYLDVGSHVADLQKARISLRSSNKISLDRASYVYPVHFEPSNWYEYLRPKRKHTISRELLELEIADIDAKLTILRSTVNDSGMADGAVEYLETLRNEHIALGENLTLLTRDVGLKKLACISSNENQTTACEEYRQAQTVLEAATKEYSIKQVKISSTKAHLHADDFSKKSVFANIEELEDKRNLLKSTLADKLKGLSANVDESSEDVSNYKWTEFDFSSVESKNFIQTSAIDYASAINFGTRRRNMWSFSGGSNNHHSKAFQEEINRNEFRIKGKVLRVVIHRPWFKPSLFMSGKIITRDGVLISPGPMAEKSFIHTLNQNKGYVLPEFSNAFLLAKDIEVEFIGVDEQSKNYALERSAKGQLSGNLGCFSISSSSFEHMETRMESESTIDGLKIKVPGAQIIGYFTTILPCFPHSSCNTFFFH